MAIVLCRLSLKQRHSDTSKKVNSSSSNTIRRYKSVCTDGLDSLLLHEFLIHLYSSVVDSFDCAQLTLRMTTGDDVHMESFGYKI